MTEPMMIEGFGAVGVPVAALDQLDGGREIPYDRDQLGRFVREAWVRWAKTQPSPKSSWLVPYDDLSEPDKEADRQIGETIARWTLIGDAARISVIGDRRNNMGRRSVVFSGGVEKCIDTETLTTKFSPLYTYTPRPANDNRRGDFMQVYPAGKFWPLDPRPEEITIEAIAHSLGMQCRYAGHVSRFYSVAEHCVHIARWILKETWDYGAALCGLLHDASEAFLVDVPRPIKSDLSNYKAIESRVMAKVCERFSLPVRLPDIVKEADDRIIGDEVALLAPMDWHKQHNNPLGVGLKCWTPAQAKEEFLATYAALSGRGMREAA